MNALFDTLIRFSDDLKIAALVLMDGCYVITIKKTPEKYPGVAFFLECKDEDAQEQESYECNAIYEVYNHIVNFIMESFEPECWYYK